MDHHTTSVNWTRAILGMAAIVALMVAVTIISVRRYYDQQDQNSVLSGRSAVDAWDTCADFAADVLATDPGATGSPSRSRTTNDDQAATFTASIQLPTSTFDSGNGGDSFVCVMELGAEAWSVIDWWRE